MNDYEQIKVPMLPGYSTSEPITGGRPKTQSLQHRNGYAVSLPVRSAIQVQAVAGPAVTGSQLWTASPSEAAPAQVPAATTPFQPKYVSLDKKVLRYFGWFGEAVPDSPLESWRLRRVEVLLYLEDGTMQVTERHAPNSGITQGTLAKRQMMPKEGGGFLQVADLAVGKCVRVYGRDMRIVDADSFTREYVAQRGVHLAPAEAYPVSPIEVVLAAKCKPSGLSHSDPDSPSSFAEALLGREHNSKSLQQFLQHGGEVLRFYMLWDNRVVQFGERHMYKLHFFVADATAEIMEVPEEPNGTTTALFPTFLKRGPLPKGAVGGALPGQGRLTPDQCYAAADLRIGATLSVLGRELFIYDCDEATRKWCQSHMEYSNEALTAIDVSEPKKALPVPELPPARFGLGIGSPEDSLQNCLRLVPKPPKRDHYRWQKLDTIVLRYEAVLEPGTGGKLINIDHERRFVVSFFMADQTIAVFEPPQPNTGLPGGKFLERAKVYKPGSKLAWYTEAEMQVGTALDLHGRRFRLVAADAFTEQWSAAHDMSGGAPLEVLY
ncbi:hypothetical protein D9Q98_002089 [Chlorella vulgaris]|uniref:DM10 domain-containing protein n=1 Tax=Chlorella vulgaris TaxID=3077 RepID=A0A9D4TVV8_CHLVU|nr:hypothetical protein D9Q98_002089 [Chlorella vulgaris]